jgi:hypothetical protein
MPAGWLLLVLHWLDRLASSVNVVVVVWGVCSHWVAEQLLRQGCDTLGSTVSLLLCNCMVAHACMT